MAKKAAKKVIKPIRGSDKSVKKAFPLIARNDLNRLLEQVAIFQNRAGTANSSAAELISTYVKSKHLHAGAFRTINRWKKLGDRDPQALWLELAHIDDMREKAGLDRIAKAQGQLLPAIADEGEYETKAEPQDVTENENVVNYPQPREVEEKAGAA
jgi:hypothetical protein